MSKVYNTGLQERLEQFLKDEGLSQAKAAPMLKMSSGTLSLYRRSCYEGDIQEVEKKLNEFFKIRDEQKVNAVKAEPYKPVKNYIPTSISESVYDYIRYCQLEKGIVIIDGDPGVGKTKAAAKYVNDNPASSVYIQTSPTTGTTRSLLKTIARALKLPENKSTDILSYSIHKKLRESNKILILDEAQNIKFMALEELRNWADEDPLTGEPGIGIVLIGNVEIYNRMLGKQEAQFAQQFSRSRLHGQFRTRDILKSDVIKLLPLLAEKRMDAEAKFLQKISHSKWGIRGMINVYNNAVNNEDITVTGLEKAAFAMGIRFI